MNIYTKNRALVNENWKGKLERVETKNADLYFVCMREGFNG